LIFSAPGFSCTLFPATSVTIADRFSVFSICLFVSWVRRMVQKIFVRSRVKAGGRLLYN
jgi:hypothetical protein